MISVLNFSPHMFHILDMNKRKKVKFLDPVNSQDLPSSRRGRVQSPNGNWNVPIEISFSSPNKLPCRNFIILILFWSYKSYLSRLSTADCDAKTSEFKSFKRLLGETNHKRMPRHNNNLKTFEVSECMRGKSKITSI